MRTHTFGEGRLLCPKCFTDRYLSAQATVKMGLDPDGTLVDTDDSPSLDWWADCDCSNCGFRGPQPCFKWPETRRGGRLLDPTIAVEDGPKPEPCEWEIAVCPMIEDEDGWRLADDHETPAHYDGEVRRYHVPSGRIDIISEAERMTGERVSYWEATMEAMYPFINDTLGKLLRGAEPVPEE